MRVSVCLHRDVTQESTPFPPTAGPYPVLRSSAVILTCFRNVGKTECVTHKDNKTLAGLLLPTSRSGRSLTAIFGFEGGCHSFVTSHRVALPGVFLLSTFCIAESQPWSCS